jgi:hypothetical protein
LIGLAMNPLREVVVFADALHPTHDARGVGGWAAKDRTLATEQTTARQRLYIHGAIGGENGQTRMTEAESVDAVSTIKLEGAEALYFNTRVIHVFLDNARYHHAKVIRQWCNPS